MVVPLSAPYKPSIQLPRQGRRWFYWYPDTDSVGLAALEVLVDGTSTWLPTAVRTDPNGVDAPAIEVAGPDADIGTASIKLARSTGFVARIVGDEIEVGYGRIDVIG